MNKKNKIALCAVAMFVTFSPVAFAAREIPKTTSLQPAPVNNQPNYSNNVNTPGSNINNTLQDNSDSAQPQTDTTDTNAPEGFGDQTSPIVGNLPETSAGYYWVWVIVGFIGLLAAGVWSYFRFLRKP